MYYNVSEQPLAGARAANQYGLGHAPFGAKEQMRRWPLLLVHGQRRSLDVVSILISVALPWLLFCTMSWAATFSLHYKYFMTCCIVKALGLAVVAVTVGLAYRDHQKKGQVMQRKEPTWFVFIGATCVAAYVLGSFAGGCNFFLYMRPYYDFTSLRSYVEVDPATVRGRALLDSGLVYFKNDTVLDLHRAIGFKDVSHYCVAPIVPRAETLRKGKKLLTYDFWAVGQDCCSSKGDFHCAGFNSPSARGGLRLLDEKTRPFFHLAVQQAEAAFNIRADHPIFFYWTQDPSADATAYWENGLRSFVLGCLSHLMLQLMLVVSASMLFALLGNK